MAWEKGVAQTVDVPTWKDGILTAPSGVVTATIIKDGAGPVVLNGTVAKIGTSPAAHLALSATDTNVACGLVLITDPCAGIDDVQFSFATEESYTAARAAKLDATALEATLAAIKGAGWTIETLKLIYDSLPSAGTGAFPVTLYVKDLSGNPIQNAKVRINATGGDAVQTTNSLGVVTFNLDAGTYTAYVGTAASYTPSASYSVIISGAGAVTTPADATLDVTAVSLPTPAPDTYAVYGIEYALDGNTLAGAAEVTVAVVECDPAALYTAADGSLRRLKGAEFETNGSGQWSIDIAKAAVATRTDICLSFEYTTGVPTKVLKLAMMDETAANASDQIAFAAWKPRIRSGVG